MSDDNGFPYSASFRMYGLEGLNVLFTIKGTEPVQHVQALTTYLDGLMAGGYMVNLPGTEPGETVEEIGAWVLGETSREEPCVYLYSVNAALKWRLATVYVEDLGQLPFSTKGAKQWPGSAPEREPAEKKGFLNAVDPFKIVMKPTGKQTESGREVMRFDRVLDAPPAVKADLPKRKAKTSKATTSNGNGTTWSAEFIGKVIADTPVLAGAGDVMAIIQDLGLTPPANASQAKEAYTKIRAEAGRNADKD